MKLKAKPLSKTPCFKNIHPGLTQRVQDYYEPMLASGFSAKESLQKAVETVYNEVSQELAALPPVPISGDDRFAAAWHGSPHTFDKFSTSAIGTGEGAQAYGYGLYFAGAREIAEWYRDKLASTELTYKGDKYLRGAYFADKILFDMGIEDDVRGVYGQAANIAAKDKVVGRNKNTYTNEVQRSVYNYVQENIQTPNAHLYKVELAPAEDEYLLWDKPLSEQSEKVREALKKERPEWFKEVWHQGVKVVTDPEIVARIESAKPTEREAQGIEKSIPADTITGQQTYFYANPEVTTKGRDDRAASEYLHSLGIRGIKYLDGTSRTGKRENYNYVIFSDQDVEITDRFSRGETDEFTTRILEEARRADEGSTLSDATKELARVLGPEFYNRASATARATKAAERSVLRKWAQQRGLIQDPTEFNAKWTTELSDDGKPIQGNEHDVTFNNGIVTKRNRMPNNYHESYAELFDRVTIFNWLFGSEPRLTFTGFQEVDGTLMPVFTQKDLGGTVARIEDTENFLSEAFEPVGAKTASFRLKGSDIIITDVFGNNTRKVGNQVVPMDYVVFHGKRANDYLAYQEAQQRAINEAMDEEEFDKQFDALVAEDRFSKPETITVDGKERPTTNSNGAPIHPTKEGIVNFWKWFGDSKVVDEQGRPLVVYHGTGGDFDAFDPNAYGKNFTGDYGVGFYFTQDEKRSGNYAQVSEGGKPNIMPAYLRINNPAKVKAAYADGDLWKMVPEAKTKDELTNGLKDQGYDGVIIDGGRSGIMFINETVAFSPTQIKSATGNTGAFSKDDNDIRYSRPFNKQEAMDEIKSYGPSLLRLLSRFSSWLQPLNRRYDSLQYATSLTDEIKGVVRQMAEQSNMQRSEQNRVLSTTKEATDQWMKAGKAGDDLPQSMELAFNASLLQLYPGKSMVDQGWGDTPEAASKAWNKAVGAKQGKDFATEYSRITREFNALSPATRKAYLGVVDVMSDLRTQLHDAYLNTIDAMPVEEEKKRTLRRTLERNFRNLKGAYMPFTRHGEYVVNVYDKTADGKLINSTRAATMGELRAQVELLKAQYPADRYEVRKFDGRVIHKAKENRISPALLEQMKGMLVDNLNQAGFSKVHRLAKQFLEDNVEQLSDDQRDLVKAIYKAGNLKSQAAAINALRDNVIDSYELVDFIQTMDTARERLTDNPGLTKAIDDLEQIFLDTLPDTSALKSSMHRKGTAGWSSDAIRSVLDYANRYGKSLAYMKHGRQVDQLEAEASRLAEGIINPDRSLKAQTLLKDTFENRRVVSEEEVGALGKFSTKLGSLWFLTSPSMILVQNSQPWAITVPYLAARYGLGDAVSAMTRNHVTYQLGGKFTDDKINAFDADLSRAPKDWNTNLPFSLSRFYAAANGETKAKILKSLTADEKNMLALRLGMDTGVIANSMSFEAVEYARKGASGQIGTALDTAAEKAYFFQRFGETLSRKGAYMAAFELATKAGDSFDEANRKAIRAVNETLYDYSATNRPRIISGTFGRFFGQFRTYQLQTWGHMLNLFAKGRTGDKAAIKELGLLMATNFVLAGATGLPLAGSLATMLGGVAFLLGEDDDWVKEIEEELLKTKAGQVVLKGAPMILGLDLSRRIGMEGLTHIFQGEAPAKATPKDQMNFYASQILGPAYAASAGAAFNIGQAIQDGDWGKAFEQGTPRAIASAFQAMKLNNKGLTDGSGRVIIPEDQISKWDVALMMIGVNPGQVSVAREKEKNIREVTDMVDLKKQRLAKDLERAVLDNDGAAIEKSQAAIQRFNQQYPMFGFTSQSLASRLRGAWQERAGITSRKYQAAELYLDRYDEEEEA